MLAVDVFVVFCACLCGTTVCVWCVVDVFVVQLSVPPVVAQTAGLHKHQQQFIHSSTTVVAEVAYDLCNVAVVVAAAVVA